MQEKLNPSDNLEFVNTIDSRVACLQASIKKKYNLPYGTTSLRSWQTPSNNGDNNISNEYTILGNDEYIFSNYVLESQHVEMPFVVSNSSTTDSVNFLQDDSFFSTRFMALLNATQTISVTYNNAVISFSPQDIIAYISTYGGDDKIFGKSLLQNNARDICSDNVTFSNQVDSSFQNPYSQYTNTDTFQSRFSSMLNLKIVDASGNPTSNVPANTANMKLTISFDIIEPFYIPQLMSLDVNTSEGMLNAASLKFKRTFVPNISDKMINFLNLDSNLTINSYSTTLSDATLYYTVISPNDGQKIKEISYYPFISYGDPQNTIKSAYGLPKGSTWTFKSPVNSLSNIPNGFYSYISKNDSELSIFDPQTCPFQITGIEIVCNNSQPQFTDMSTIQLYEEFCAREGCSLKFQDTCYSPVNNSTTGAIDEMPMFGSVLRIPIESISSFNWKKYSAGSQMKFNVQLKVTCKNLIDIPVDDVNNYTLKFIPIYQRVLVVNGTNNSTVYDGILTEEDIEYIRKQAMYEYVSHPKYVGASFWGTLKDIGNKVVSAIPTVIKYAPQAIDLAKSTGLLAAGMKKTKSHKLKGLKLRGGSYDESELDDQENMQGGVLISKSQLAKRLY